MRRCAWLAVALLGACTALRPLDSELDARVAVDARAGDAGNRDARTGVDADFVQGDAPSPDARGPDAPLPDAPGLDAAMQDAPSIDVFFGGDANCLPVGPEQCNNLRDEDCDGAIDEGDAIDAQVWYPDLDRDGYGSDVGAVTACREPVGEIDWRDRGGDCDDTTRDVRPGRLEQCNAIDDDCDGLLDEGNPCSATGGCTTEARDGHTYQFCDGRISWDEASTRCASWGYHLVKIEDAAENDWVASTGIGHGLGGGAGATESVCHIGLRRTGMDYLWTDGTAATFTSWGVMEPDGMGDCVRIRNAAGDWSDYLCSEPYDFVCETP